MKKRIFTMMLSIFILMLSSGPIYAQDDTLITYEGDSGKFITQEGTSQGFEDMMPGETRKVSVRLKNDHYDKMDYFMSAEILDNIAEKGNQDAVYEFYIARDDEVFFSTVIGGTGNSVGQEYLTDDNKIKLAQLAKDEECLVTVSLSLDGDSTENSYQNKDGQIQLNFLVGTPESTMANKQTIINRIIEYVKTGDNAPLIIMGGLLIISASVIVFIKYKRREEN
ncbi:MAG: LPXTG cell wall anchor domain-containing protein [Thomasclavelia sp.]|uniref:LPXTG cell wall anchor domain-containing protein n=1 Tax=Thomasclavelia sp. TaxID=3025757 RepID=UPI0039A23164